MSVGEFDVSHRITFQIIIIVYLICKEMHFIGINPFGTGKACKSPLPKYCKFRIFHENIILANCLKRHICDIQNSQPGHDLPASVNNRVKMSFREGLFSKIEQS